MCRFCKKGTSARQRLAAVAVCHETEMPDFDESCGEYMQQETANEIDGVQCHEFLLIGIGRVSPAECHLTISHLDQSPIGDRDTMRVTSQIPDYVLRAAKWALGVDHPDLTAQLAQ